MSRFIASKKFCKVCKDAGKSESEYTSHFTRETNDPNAKVVCPTLLSLECRFCHKNGHTVKYCSVLQDREKLQKRQEKEQRYVSKRIEQSVPSKPIKKTSTNVFAFLESDSEEEVAKEEFPALAPVSVAKPANKLSYAGALVSKPSLAPIIIPKSTFVKPAAKLAPWATKPIAKSSFWDEESDEESEDEDEYDYVPSYNEDDDFDDCEDFNTNRLLLKQVQSTYVM
jgi:hypothetical protein